MRFWERVGPVLDVWLRRPVQANLVGGGGRLYCEMLFRRSNLRREVFPVGTAPPVCVHSVRRSHGGGTICRA